MGLAEVVRIEEATDKILELTRDKVHKPVMVGVYGVPNHGKTYFTLQFMREAETKGKLVAYSNGPEDLRFFSRANYYLVNFPLSNPTSIFNLTSATRQLKGQIGRGYDLHIAVVNPRMHNIDMDACKALYDLVVLNPDSKVKLPRPL